MNPISQWLNDYSRNNGNRVFVVGISGGVDSALTSTLCAETGVHTIVLSLPIHQHAEQLERARLQIDWLKRRYLNVTSLEIDLTEVFESFKRSFSSGYDRELGLANSRARLRMTALYQIAASCNGMVVGTGNKVEDFGVGFFTKYGDGGVDLSPLADLLKSEVRQMARDLGVPEPIVTAIPTDGLWQDNRSDEAQLQATYDELEWAMAWADAPTSEKLTDRQKQVLQIFRAHREATRHKLEPIPAYKKPPPE